MAPSERSFRIIVVAAVVALLSVACGIGVKSAAEGRTTLAAGAPTPTADLPFPAPTSSASQGASTPSSEADEQQNRAPINEVATTAPIPTVADDVTPTPLAVPELAPTPTRVAGPTSPPEPEREPTPAPTATPRPTMTPTAIQAATSTPTETATEADEPTDDGSSEPEASATPEQTATPTPVVTVSGGIAQVGISCEIVLSGPANVGEQVQARVVQQNRADVDYLFELGDGTTASGRSVTMSYDTPGVYAVSLRWRVAGEIGVVECGTVRVVLKQELAASAADFVGLSEAEAEALAAERTLTLRVSRRDLILLPGTTDFRVDRVTVEIDNGFVASASIG